MEVIALSGDAYTTEDEFYKVCRRENRYLTYYAFLEDLHYLLKERHLYLEGRRLYTTLLWRYEQSAAQNLAHILKAPFLSRAQIPENLEVNGVRLTEEQRSAVELALSSPSVSYSLTLQHSNKTVSGRPEPYASAPSKSTHRR